jgi:hypothetical protein
MNYIAGRTTYVVADLKTQDNPCGHPHGSPAEAWQCHTAAIEDLSQPLRERNVYASDGGRLRLLNDAEWVALRDYWRLTLPTRIELVEEEPGPPAPSGLTLSAGDAARMRSLLRSITQTAGGEPASEEALEACGRAGARALAILNQAQSLTTKEKTHVTNH